MLCSWAGALMFFKNHEKLALNVSKWQTHIMCVFIKCEIIVFVSVPPAVLE